MRSITLTLLIILQQAWQTNALKCQPVVLIIDGRHDEIELSCQVGDRILAIDNYLKEFDEFLVDFITGPHVNNPNFSLIFHEASIVNHKFHIPSNSTMIYDSIRSDNAKYRSRGRRLGGEDPLGDQRVLVLYVEDAFGNKPDYVADGEAGSIEDNVFGTYGDTIYPGERYMTCSNGHVNFVPWIGTTSTNVPITTGVYHINISYTVPGTATRVIEDAVEAKAAAELGDLRSQFDYVMICLPYGSVNSYGSAGWGGYAYINHYLQVLNNNRCQRISTMVHEFGHNLNLGHSGQGDSQYADQIGYMGYSYSGDDTPLMCFNGPKTFQLNWFPDHCKTLTNLDFNWSGDLYHPLDEDNITGDGMMVIKIPGFPDSFSGYSADYSDYYVSFNKQSGENVGTQEAINRVAIHISQNRAFYAWAPKSKIVAELAVGGSFEFTALDIIVVVEVTEINLSSNPPYASVTISSGTESPSLSIVPSLSTKPSQSPSAFPSIMPSPVNGISLSPTSLYTQLYTNFLVGEFWAASKSGIMFDIVATDDVAITRIDIDLFYVGFGGLTFPTDVEIYTKEGSYLGYEANMAVWTKHMDTTTVQPPDVLDFSTLGLTPLGPNILSPILIGKDTTVSVYITNRDANNFIEMAYSSTALPYSDDTITVKTGYFQKYGDFNSNEDPDGFWWEAVAFSGIIHYDKGAFPSAQPSKAISGAPSLSQVPTLSRPPSSTPSKIPSASPSGSPSISMAPSSEPSINPSLSLSPSESPSLSFAPSKEPSSSPSDNPSVSFAPSKEPSSSPSDNPSVSFAPSKEPSSSPSGIPSASPSSTPTVVPSVAPSRDPSVIPTMKPTSSRAPSQEPTEMPSTTISPTKSPVKPPPPPTTKRPTQAPNTDTLSPTISSKPTKSPTEGPTASPTTSLVPTGSPSDTKITQSPSDPRFQVITTTCSCVSPFKGISPEDLADRFAAIVALLEAVMLKVLGPDRSGWGTRVVRVGNLDTRRLLFHDAREKIYIENSVDVEYEFSKSETCLSVNGCDTNDQDSSINEGLAVLEDVTQSVNSGQFTELITNDAAEAGLDELSDVVVEEVVVVEPEVEIIEITAFPSVTKSSVPTLTQNPSVAVTTQYPSIQPTNSPTFSPCTDSPFRFDVKKDGKIMRRSCSWVANHPILKCKLKGVSSHCQQTCSNCESCVDSPFKVQFMFNKKDYLRSCDWVARKDVQNRCSVDGISDTCRSTCGRCTSPPTIAPSCFDSSYRFDVMKDGEIKRRSCKWVANHPILKCKLDGVSSHCPQTCSSCDICTNSLFKFRLEHNGKEHLRSCKWVRRKATAKRCSIGDISNTCRRTCGAC